MSSIRVYFISLFLVLTQTALAEKKGPAYCQFRYPTDFSDINLKGTIVKTALPDIGLKQDKLSPKGCVLKTCTYVIEPQASKFLINKCRYKIAELLIQDELTHLRQTQRRSSEESAKIKQLETLKYNFKLKEHSPHSDAMELKNWMNKNLPDFKVISSLQLNKFWLFKTDHEIPIVQQGTSQELEYRKALTPSEDPQESPKSPLEPCDRSEKQILEALQCMQVTEPILGTILSDDRVSVAVAEPPKAEATGPSQEEQFRERLNPDGKLNEKAIAFLLHSNGLINRSYFKSADETQPDKLQIRKVKASEIHGQSVDEIFQVNAAVSDSNDSERPFRPVYIIKTTKNETRCKTEAHHLEKLNESDLVNPNWTKSRLSKALLADLPKVSLFEKGVNYLDQKGKPHCLLLLHAAQGNSFGDLFDRFEKGDLSEERFEEALFKLGKSIGALHLAHMKEGTETVGKMNTWIHSDLHSGNVFFDLQLNQITLIDNGDFKRGDPNADVDYFLRKSFLRQVDFYLNKLEDSPDDLRRFGTKSDTIKQEIITNAETSIKRLESHLKLIQIFIRGYVSHFPDSKRAIMEKFLIEKYYQKEKTKFETFLLKWRETQDR